MNTLTETNFAFFHAMCVEASTLACCVNREDATEMYNLSVKAYIMGGEL